MAASTGNRKFVNNHFRIPSLLWFLLLDGGMVLLYLEVFRPDLVPFSDLGKDVGGFLSHLATEYHTTLLYVFYFAILVHVLEATWAYFICRDVGLTGAATLMWTLQTLIVGFPSLNLLRLHRSHCIIMGLKLD